MKRGTPDHPKMMALAEQLGCSFAEAVGLMELLWHWTAKYAPAGDIGRWSDAAIEAGIRWSGEPGKYVRTACACGWFDESIDCRLVVHDWFEHCEDSIHNSLYRAGKLFADGRKPRGNRLSIKERRRLDREHENERTASARRAHGERTAKPCQAKPSHAMPVPILPSSAPDPDPPKDTTEPPGQRTEGRTDGREKKPSKQDLIRTLEQRIPDPVEREVAVRWAEGQDGVRFPISYLVTVTGNLEFNPMRQPWRRELRATRKASEAQDERTRRRATAWRERRLPKPPVPMTLDDYEQHLEDLKRDGNDHDAVLWTLGLGEIRNRSIDPPPGVSLDQRPRRTVASLAEFKATTDEPGTIVEDERALESQPAPGDRNQDPEPEDRDGVDAEPRRRATGPKEA